MLYNKMLSENCQTDTVITNTLGIDFGTTNSCISYINNDSCPVVIPNPEGTFTTPSCVYFDIESKDILFGVAAHNLLQSNNNTLYLSNIITNIKRLVGITYQDWTSNLELQQFFERKNTKVVTDENGLLGVELTHNNTVIVFSIHHIVKAFLLYIKNISEEYLGKQVHNIVITVPAYFSDLQRCHIKECCESIDLNVVRIINEPTAAALAYAREHKAVKTQENVIVIDCGGGTTDISLLTMDYEDQVFEVKNVTGDNFLGGEDITDSLISYVIQKLGLDAKGLSPKQLNKLKNGCEKMKQQLSFNSVATLHLESFNSDHDIQLSVSRELLISVCKSFFSNVRRLIQHTVIGYSVDKVVLVGGTTRIPYISEICRCIFGEDVSICNTLDPDQTISIGAAVQGYLLSHNTINPDSDTVNTLEMTVIDVVPLSLGVETMGGLLNIIVSKNTCIPTSRTQVFTNSDDHISELDIKVYQGDRKLVRDNKCLATFKMTNLDPDYKRGDMNIKVTFNIDADGILCVDAEETKSNSKQRVTIDVEKLTGIEHSFNTLSITPHNNNDEDFTFQDSHKSNQILAKLELYDTFKYILAFYHDNKHTFVLTSFQDKLLNDLFNKIFCIVQEYDKYSPTELQEYRISFENDFNSIIMSNNNFHSEQGSSIID